MKGQEGELRASAVVIEGPDGGKACLVACDVLMVERDVLDAAARRIAETTGIPFDAVLINATHTHHAAHDRDDPRLRARGGVHPPGRGEGRRRGGRGERPARAGDVPVPARRGVVGRQEQPPAPRRRHDLLGRARWPTPSGRPARSTPSCRSWPSSAPTAGPRPCCSTTRPTPSAPSGGAVRSPSFYGLAAQELEAERGGTFLFFEGASGSTHNLDLKAPEALTRIKAAVSDALDRRGGAARDPRRGPAQGDHAAGPDLRRGEGGRGGRRLLHQASAPAVPREDDRGSSARCARSWRPGRARSARPGCRRSWSATSPWWASRASSSPCSGARSSSARPTATRSSSSWPTTTSATSPTPRAYDRGGYQVWTGLHSYLEKGSGRGDRRRGGRPARRASPRGGPGPLTASTRTPPCPRCRRPRRHRRDTRDRERAPALDVAVGRRRPDVAAASPGRGLPRPLPRRPGRRAPDARGGTRGDAAGRPVADDRAGRGRAGGRQPRGLRLGRTRPALRGRDDAITPPPRPAAGSSGSKTATATAATSTPRSSPRASLTPTASCPGTAASSSPPRPTCCSSRTPTATARPTSAR